MKKITVNFNVAIEYDFLRGSTTPRDTLAQELKQAIEHEMKNHGLDEPEFYRASACAVFVREAVYSECEMDAVLCVFDAMREVLNDTRDNQKLAEIIADIHEAGGVAAIRQTASDIGKAIESAWQRNSDVTCRVNVPFDLEFIPAVLETACNTYETLALTSHQWDAITLRTCEQFLAQDIEGLFIYCEKSYKSPFEAYSAGQLANVEGYERTPDLAQLSAIINSVSKTLTFTESPYTVVYVKSGFYTSYFDDFPKGATVNDWLATQQ